MTLGSVFLSAVLLAQGTLPGRPAVAPATPTVSQGTATGGASQQTGPAMSFFDNSSAGSMPAIGGQGSLPAAGSDPLRASAPALPMAGGAGAAGAAAQPIGGERGNLPDRNGFWTPPAADTGIDPPAGLAQPLVGSQGMKSPAPIAAETDDVAPPAQQAAPGAAGLPDMTVPIRPQTPNNVAAEAASNEPSGADGASQASQANVATAATRQSIANLLRLPEGSPAKGSPLTLREAIGATVDRPRQLEITHLYWRLNEAVGTLRATWDEAQQLQQLQSSAQDAGLLNAARNSAAARLQAAALGVSRVQHELAEMAAIAPGTALPLPADLPHVGGYDTYYERLAKTRAMPARARLIDRTLPLRRQVIDARMAAFQAARLSLEANLESHRYGQTSLATVLDSVGEAARQQESLIAAVCQYNHDIADYALTVVGPQVNGETIVSMLIKTNRQPTPAAGSSGDVRRMQDPLVEASSDVQHATHNEPAVPRNEPTLAAPRKPAVKDAADAADMSAEDRPATADAAQHPAADEPPLEPIKETWTSRRQTTALPTVRLYEAIVNVSPAARAKQLATALYWSQSLPESAGEPIELRECLRNVPALNRRAVVEAYWTAARRAAEYQVLAAERDLLDGLAGAAAQPGAVLDAARQNVRARLLEAEAALIESQFELAGRAGRTQHAKGLLPTTTPHAGPYALKLEAQPREIAESWPIKRLAAAIPGLAENLSTRASTVVELDGLRAQTAADYQVGKASLTDVLDAIQRQSSETIAAIGTLTDYNLAIAEYVARVIPAGTTNDRLVGSLVVSQ